MLIKMNRFSLMLIAVLAGFCSSCEQSGRFIYAKDEYKIEALKDTVLITANRKLGVRFNAYRRQAGLPELPDSFVLSNFGGDFVTWNTLSTDRPCLLEKTICFIRDEPSLIWEHNLYKGPDNDAFRLRYIRNDSDSFIINYTRISPASRIESDQGFSRGYVYFDKKGGFNPVNKRFYDSLMLNWGISH